MKSLFVIVFCLFGSKAFSQTTDVMVEEKSSEWIKVTAAVVSKPRTTTVKRNTTTTKPATRKQGSQEEFEKTNQQVNRFKKGKKD
jgi:hypothetical protein